MEDEDKADHAMKDTSDMVEKLHNRELCPVLKNEFSSRPGGWRTGCNTSSTKYQVAILSTKTRVAEPILTISNSEDLYSTPGDALFRSGKYAWIVKGKHLAILYSFENA